MHLPLTERLQGLVKVFVTKFPHSCGPLLLKRPEPGPPILSTDRLCLNPFFEAQVRVVVYSQRQTLSVEQLEEDWQVRMNVNEFALGSAFQSWSFRAVEDSASNGDSFTTFEDLIVLYFALCLFELAYHFPAFWSTNTHARS